ncbi:hypothetical protein [Planctomyces sp. SH-PL14]|uniref:hypothetical protein n=1 Tax=Planctomyces sp. SH-PL14 TaxID=1632864 RepID=UPI0009468605|nr:hypothetical protein [Planctomyces sp. SH-PL14]
MLARRAAGLRVLFGQDHVAAFLGRWERIISKNRNTLVKRQREQDKRRRAEDKRVRKDLKKADRGTAAVDGPKPPLGP